MADNVLVSGLATALKYDGVAGYYSFVDFVGREGWTIAVNWSLKEIFIRGL
jgi:hypothetical protein